MSKDDTMLFAFIVFFFPSLFSHFPTMCPLPQGRLIKTNAIVGYHCYTGAHRAAGSYFSFSLVWWCDFVFFRNRFVSNGSVYLSSLSPFPHPLGMAEDGYCGLLQCHIPSQTDFRIWQTQTSLQHWQVLWCSDLNSNCNDVTRTWDKENYNVNQYGHRHSWIVTTEKLVICTLKSTEAAIPKKIYSIYCIYLKLNTIESTTILTLVYRGRVNLFVTVWWF